MKLTKTWGTGTTISMCLHHCITNELIFSSINSSLISPLRMSKIMPSSIKRLLTLTLKIIRIDLAYSTVYNIKSREKELEWIDNFAVKRSKDNNQIYKKFKEFFYHPKKYEYDRTVGKTIGIVKHSIQIKMTRVS